MDDVLEIAKAFQKEYGGYGLTEDQNLDCFKILAPAWGANPGIWIEGENGKLAYGSVQLSLIHILSGCVRPSQYRKVQAS